MNQMNEYAQYLLRSIFQMHEYCEKLNKGKSKAARPIKSGIVDNLAGLKYLLSVIGRKHGEGHKSVGFFGGQKRGKSSLINLLLGCDLMPTAFVPMTSAIVYVENDPAMKEGQFYIEKETHDGSFRKSPDLSLQRAQDELREYVSHQGSQSSDVSSVRVKSNFRNSKILVNGGVLVDTPGAECAFEKKKSPRRIKGMQENEADAQRARQALEQVQVVVFVEKPEGLESKTSRELFEKRVHAMRPLCVVNFRDQYELDSKTLARYVECDDAELKQRKLDDAKTAKLKNKMLSAFDVPSERTFCLSCKEASPENATGDGVVVKEDKLWTQSGVADLEKKIISEIENLDAAKGVLTCIRDLGTFLAQLEKTEGVDVEEVYASGLSAMYVFMRKVAASDIETKEKEDVVNEATKLFKKYAPQKRRRFADVREV